MADLSTFHSGPEGSEGSPNFRQRFFALLVLEAKNHFFV